MKLPITGEKGYQRQMPKLKQKHMENTKRVQAPLIMLGIVQHADRGSL